MSYRITILKALIEMNPDKKAGASTGAVKKHLKSTSTKVSAILWQLAKDGVIGKVKMPKHRPNMWVLNNKSVAVFEANKNLVFNSLEMEQYEQGERNEPKYARVSTAKAVKKAQVNKQSTRYSPMALGAIDGITELVNTNEVLIASLRVIKSTIDNVLKEYDHDHEPEEPKNG